MGQGLSSIRVGSAWTAQEPLWGWRHFQVKNIQRRDRFTFVEMVAVCDPQVRFWLNAQQLRNRTLWQPGWHSLSSSQDPPEGMPPVPPYEQETSDG